jgi:hypothetical protein
VTQASSDKPIAEFAVRTAPGYWLVGGAMVVLALLGTAMLTFLAMTTGVPGAAAVAVACVAAVAPIAYWVATPAYRIGGGRGAIRFYADRLEVPAARGAATAVVLSRDGLTASATEMRVRYRIGAIQAATLRRGHMVELVAGQSRRRLSTLTIDKPADFIDALATYLGAR